MTEAVFTAAVGTLTTGPNGSSSAAVAIPVGVDGTKPKFIRVAVTSNTHFAIGTSAIVATTGHMLISLSDSQIISSAGHTHYAVYGNGGASSVVVTPLENQK